MKFPLHDTGVWFDLPDDPDNGAVCLRVYNNDIIKKIQKQAIIKKAQYHEQNCYEFDEQDQDAYNSLLWEYCIIDWKNIYDDQGNDIPCTNEMKLLLMGGSITFANFVKEQLNNLIKLHSGNEEKFNKNLDDWVEWAYNPEKPSCEVCQRMYANKNQEPPCVTCRVELISNENEDIISVFNLVQDQVDAAWDGTIIGLRTEAVKITMDLLEISNQKQVFLKVKRLFGKLQEKRRLLREASK